MNRLALASGGTLGLENLDHGLTVLHLDLDLGAGVHPVVDDQFGQRVFDLALDQASEFTRTEFFGIALMRQGILDAAGIPDLDTSFLQESGNFSQHVVGDLCADLVVQRVEHNDIIDAMKIGDAVNTKIFGTSLGGLQIGG